MGCSELISDKIEVKIKTILRDKKNHYIMIGINSRDQFKKEV